MHAFSRGFQIHYVAHGAGPALVMIPGLLMSAARWEAVGYVNAFGDAFRVLAVDPLGHGLSEKPHEDANYLLEDCARDILAVLDAEGVHEADVWGYSRGGQIGRALAMVAPERIRSLILGGSGVPMQPESTSIPQGWQEVVEAVRTGGWGPFWNMIGVTDAADMAVLRENQDVEAIVAAMRGRYGSRILQTGFNPAVLRRPPLVYAGSEEAQFARLEAEATAAGAEFRVIPGRGHPGAFQDISAVEPIVRAYLAC